VLRVLEYSVLHRRLVSLQQGCTAASTVYVHSLVYNLVRTKMTTLPFDLSDVGFTLVTIKEYEGIFDNDDI
jgi:hypothetical protein